MKFAILGLLIVLLIGFFVVVWKAAKDWRWYNIVAVCITMLLAMTFIFPTAGVLGSRKAWHKYKQDLEFEAAAVKVENRRLRYGDPSNPEAGEGVVALSQRVAKLGIEAGRRWRGLRFQNAANNAITLVKPQPQTPAGIPSEPPEEGQAPPAEPTALVPESLIVYGFAESQIAEQMMVPTFYLGEFRVTGSTPNQVTISPTGPLEAAQLQRLKSPSWSLYELLPLDGHDPFIALGSVSSDDNFLGRVDEELVKQLLGNKVSPETISTYLRDGNRATQDDPPISRWTKIEFLKPYSIDVDSPSQSSAMEDKFFDGNGRSLDARLQRGGDGQVRFKKGDQVLVKEEAAGPLIDEQVARLIDEYYLRPLNDYRFVLRRIRLRLTELQNRMKDLAQEKTVLDGAIEKTDGMLVFNQDTKLKLEQDLKQFRTEKAAIEGYTETMRRRVQEMRAEMIRLHQENLKLEQQLEARHRAIEQQFGSSLTPVSRAPSSGQLDRGRAPSSVH